MFSPATIAGTRILGKQKRSQTQVFVRIYHSDKTGEILYLTMVGLVIIYKNNCHPLKLYYGVLEVFTSHEYGIPAAFGHKH